MSESVNMQYLMTARYQKRPPPQQQQQQQYTHTQIDVAHWSVSFRPISRVSARESLPHSFRMPIVPEAPHEL